jgi:hypothetical protein
MRPKGVSYDGGRVLGMNRRRAIVGGSAPG